MKSVIAILAVGILSVSATAHAQQPANSSAPGGMSAGPAGAMQGPLQPGQAPQLSGRKPSSATGVGVPQLPPNLADPVAASQASADIYAFMALFQQMAQQQRDAAREQRDATRDMQAQLFLQIAEQMKQAAAAIMQQAQINGAMQIAAGMVQTGAGGTGVQSQTKQGAPAKTTSGTVVTGQTPAKMLTAQEKQQAMGSIATAQQVFSASMAAADADKKKAEAAAAQTQVQSAQQAQAQQMMQQMQDMIRDIQQKLLAIQQSQTVTAQAFLR